MKHKSLNTRPSLIGALHSFWRRKGTKGLLGIDRMCRLLIRRVSPRFLSSLLILSILSLCSCSSTVASTLESSTPLPVAGTPSDEIIDRLALNDAASQDRGGVVITILRILFDEMEDLRPTLTADLFSSPVWEDALLGGEIILQIENSSSGMVVVNPWQGGVVEVRGEEIEPFYYHTLMNLYEYPDGAVYPGQMKTIGFWFGLDTARLQDISTVVYVIDAPLDESGEPLGADFGFEIDLSSRPNEALPELLSPTPVAASGGEGTSLQLTGSFDNLAAAWDGTVYRTNQSNGFVQHYNARGERLRYWWFYDYYDRDYLDIHLYVGSSDTGAWRIPGERLYGSVSGVSLAPDGQLYVVSEDNYVFQFDADGTYVTRWGGAGYAPGEFSTPEDVAVASDGTVFVVDSGNARIQRFLPNGQFYQMWCGIESCSHLGVAISDSNEVYVRSELNGRVVRLTNSDSWPLWQEVRNIPDGLSFQDSVAAPDGTVYTVRTNAIRQSTADGQFLTELRDFWDDPRELVYPNGIAIAPDNTAYIADQAKGILHFSAEGQFLGAWNRFGHGRGEFYFLYDVAVAPDGTVYVADTGNHRIQYFSRDGAFLGMWGSLGDAPGQFDGPVSVTVAPDGTVFVYDVNNNSIQQFSADGRFLNRW